VNPPAYDPVAQRSQRNQQIYSRTKITGGRIDAGNRPKAAVGAHVAISIKLGCPTLGF